jgi:hypothetical protein
MKMTVQFSGVSRLWIRLLVGMALSSCNRVLGSTETHDDAGIRPHPGSSLLNLVPTVGHYRRPGDEPDDQDPYGDRPAEECRNR